ncbi:MAG: hypothetical protein KDI44_16405 [Thiothrix sp.]|nr:hypothetical protein [Thiothrix sp.]
MSLINIDAVLQKIAAEYGIIVDRKDPLSVALIMHAEVLQGYETATRQSQLELQAAIAAIHEAEARAGRVYTQQLASKTVNAVELALANGNRSLEHCFQQQREALDALLDDRLVTVNAGRNIALAGAALSGLLALVCAGLLLI